MRGGKREGSGRPKSGNMHDIHIKLTTRNKEWLDRQRNKTQVINDLLDEAQKSTKSDP